MVVTPEVALFRTPAVLLVTVKITVQLLLAGMVMPEKLSAVAPPTRLDGEVPAQVPVTAPATALMLLRLSVKAPPVRAVALLLDKVRVMVELPPD